MKYTVIALIAAAALILFFYFRKPAVKKQEEETPPLDPTGAGFSMGGGGAAGFQPGDVSGLIFPTPQVLLVQPPRLTYNEIKQRRIAGVKQFGNVQFKPAPGSNIVTTGTGATATIGANPNKPRFT